MQWMNLYRTYQLIRLLYLSLVVRKPAFGVSDKVRHKPDSAITEYGLRLEISGSESRGVVLSV